MRSNERLSGAPLLSALKRHLSHDYSPLHFPAHKGGRGWPSFWLELVGDKLARLDLTELPGLGDLHSPQGPVAESQKMVARLFGAAQSYFLVNGVSVGLMAALLGLCQPGDLVLLPRHGHRCLVSAAVVSGIRPAFLRGEVDRAWGLPLGVTGQEVEEALNRFPETKAVVLVYPTYEGVSPDLARAVEAAHRRGVKVVVDAAHGAHFGFHPQFPPRALALGADVVVDGWHKTLGSLTQTAVLHLREESESLSRVAWALDLLQTTSPSYVLLSSLEALCLQLAERGGELWEGALAAAGEVRSWVRAQKGLALWEPGPGWLQDPLRVVVSARDYGYGGAELAAMLREHGKIVVEAWGAYHVLMVLSFADGPECAPTIIRALQRIEPKPGPAQTEEEVFLKGIALPPAPLTPREAFFASQRLVPLSQASGKIAARPIVPYPPGIPICWPGEVVEEDVVAYVTALVARGGQVQGVTSQMKVAVVAE